MRTLQCNKKRKNHPHVAQTTQTEEFMFQNVAYRAIVYKSGFEGPRDENSNTKVLQPNFRLRPISKAVYAIVLVTFSIYFGYSTVPNLLSKDYDDINLSLYNSTLGNKYNYTVCESLCSRQGVNQSEIEAYSRKTEGPST